MVGWLARLAQVLASCGPVFVAFFGLVATAATIWGSYEALSSVGVAAVESLNNLAESAVAFVESAEAGASSASTGYGVDGLAQFLLRGFACDQFLELFGWHVGILYTVASIGFGLAATLIEAALSVYLYRKAKLFANIVSGSGAVE